MHYSIENVNPVVTLRVGARASKLSQTQVQEVLALIQHNYPSVEFETTFVKSTGDIRQDISLRTLEKTDFFTKEIDDMLLNGACRIGIHSAKDLPEPLPKGLVVVALTKGLDSSDSLVLRENETLDRLPAGAVIATSSERREEAVKELRKDLTFIDIRGTIDMRLAKLESGEADGVVVAEAALIRLGLADLNRIKLPGDTTKHQGRLAVVARVDDEDMAMLFKCINC